MMYKSQSAPDFNEPIMGGVPGKWDIENPNHVNHSSSGGTDVHYFMGGSTSRSSSSGTTVPAGGMIGSNIRNKSLSLSTHGGEYVALQGKPNHLNSNHVYDDGSNDLEHSKLNAGNSNAGDVDPFFVFKDELLSKLQRMEESLSHFVTFVHDTNTLTSSNQVKDAKKQLKKHIKDAEATVEDLQMTVRLVESKREQFVHIINDSELRNRKAFVTSSLDRIQKAKDRMKADDIQVKINADEQKRKTQQQQFKSHSLPLNQKDAAFMENNQMQSQMLLQKQDETLDELDQAVGRVGMMAENIHEELGQQNKMLQEMDEDMTEAEQKLGAVMGKLSKLLKTQNKWQLWTILILTIIVCVLFFIVINF